MRINYELKSFLAFVIFFTSLHLVAGSARAEKALLVTDDGRIVGERTIRDISQCGRDMGPYLLAEGDIGKTSNMRLECSSRFEPARFDASSWPGAEVSTVVNQGPSENRIDLVIVGDGYTEGEKAKFYDDAKKIVADLFGANTFKTYLPLFNVHVVFVPSRVSGIGDGSPKDTALGLYRHPTVRQAVMPGNSSAARRATQLAPDVDYPILVGNDRFYGGLGGAFAITTSAPLNLTTVLRHELGHNFGQVGEEYDGGQVYRGGNFSSSKNVSWRHFVEGPVEYHEAKLLHYSAPWQNLSRGAWQKPVVVPAGYSRLFLDFSSLGFDTAEDARVSVDGVTQKYDGDFNYDRNFYRVEQSVAPGRHVVTVEEQVHDGNNILSKMGIYALPENFPKGDDQHGAFLTYDESNSAVGYRPTNHYCLMRDMHSRHFCKACTETMWKNFLSEVSLVDSVRYDAGNVIAELIEVGDRAQVRWFDPSGKERTDLNGLKTWTPTASDSGTWTVEARFVSPEVQAPNHESWSVHRKTVRVP